MKTRPRPKYTREKIAEVSTKLKGLPPVETGAKEYSKSGVVQILSKEIAVLRKNGYTLEQIAEILRTEEIDISRPTLQNYLQRAKPRKKISGRGNQKPKGDVC